MSVCRCVVIWFNNRTCIYSSFFYVFMLFDKILSMGRQQRRWWWRHEVSVCVCVCSCHYFHGVTIVRVMERWQRFTAETGITEPQTHGTIAVAHSVSTVSPARCSIKRAAARHPRYIEPFSNSNNGHIANATATIASQYERSMMALMCIVYCWYRPLCMVYVASCSNAIRSDLKPSDVWTKPIKGYMLTRPDQTRHIDESARAEAAESLVLL